MDSDTAAKQKAFREVFASAHIGSGTVLPAAAVTNVGDVWIFPQQVLNGLSWRDISDVATEITSAEAGDVGLYLPRSGWVRVGNILTGRGDAMARAAVASLTIRLNYLERRGGATLQLYHLGSGGEQYTQAEFVALADQNLTITGHIDDPALLPTTGRFFLLITNGDGSHAIKTQGAGGDSVLQVFQGNAVERTARNQLTAGTVQFTFQISAAEMTALFVDSSNDPIDASFIEFQVGMSELGAAEDDVLAAFYEHLVGTAGLTPEQSAEIQRAGQGVQTALAAAQRNTVDIAENKSAIEANTAARWPGVASVTPIELTHDIGAFTMRATLDRVTGTYPSGAHMRIVAGGRNGALVPAVENDFNTPATLAFTAVQATALIAQARNHVVRAELRIYDDDQATTHIGTLPLDLPVVQPNTLLAWRVLTGSSPYTVRLTDSEFLVETIQFTNTTFNLIIARAQLTPGTARVFVVAENNPDLAASQIKVRNVTVTLNAAGTQLTVIGSGARLFTMGSVYAR